MPVLPDKLKTVSPDYWNSLPETNKRKPGTLKLEDEGLPFAALRPLPRGAFAVRFREGTSKAEVLGLGLEDAQEAWMTPFRCPGVEMGGWKSQHERTTKKNFQKSMDLLGKRGWFWRPLIFKTSLNSCWFTVTSWKLLWGPLTTPCISELLIRSFFPGRFWKAILRTPKTCNAGIPTGNATTNFYHNKKISNSGKESELCITFLRIQYFCQSSVWHAISIIVIGILDTFLSTSPAPSPLQRPPATSTWPSGHVLSPNGFQHTKPTNPGPIW